jgi:transposase
MNTQNKNIIAIDIAKSTLQVQTENSSFVIGNDKGGFKRLDKQLSKLSKPHVVCEATGGYERPLVRHLFEQEVSVSVVNPSTVRAFAKGEGIKAKTDPIDAKMLLKYGQTRELKPSQRPDPAREELAALMDRRSQLSDSLTREKNRLDKDPAFTRKLIEKSVRFLEKQIEEVDKRIEGILASNDSLTKLVDRMTEVKGVGKTTALTILAYLPDLDSLSRGQMVSLSGLAPFNRESGKTRSRAFIQGGRAKVRKCLYMAAQSAAQHNDVIKTYVTRLMDAGQPYKSALVAAMRKILICLRSLLMNPKFRLA